MIAVKPLRKVNVEHDSNSNVMEKCYNYDIIAYRNIRYALCVGLHKWNSFSNIAYCDTQ